MITAARPYLTKQADSLNQNPYHFNCLNGVLDLKTGKLSEHQRSDFLTEIAGTEFDENATCPQFEQFIFEVCNQDNDLVRYMQTVLGYGLTGCTDEQKMFIIHGTGSNGKGTLVETIKAILGDYAIDHLVQYRLSCLETAVVGPMTWNQTFEQTGEGLCCWCRNVVQTA